MANPDLDDDEAANDEQAQVVTDTRSFPIRCSHLKAMGRSAAHCRHAILSDFEPTLSMRLGSGAHSLLLGGPRLVAYPGKVRRGKEWDAFEAANTDAIILSASELRKAEAMAAAVRGDEVANRVLFAEGMAFEHTILWEQFGRARRCTPDAMNKSILVDLKTTRDASPEAFQRQAIRLGYHVQMGDYCAAYTSHHGHEPRDVYIVAVENTPPYGCSTWRMTAGALDAGAKLARGWLEQLIACEASGIWPGYSTGVIDFEVPIAMDDLVFGEDEDDSNEGTEAA